MVEYTDINVDVTTVLPILDHNYKNYTCIKIPNLPVVLHDLCFLRFPCLPHKQMCIIEKVEMCHESESKTDSKRNERPNIPQQSTLT